MFGYIEKSGLEFNLVFFNFTALEMSKRSSGHQNYLNYSGGQNKEILCYRILFAYSGFMWCDFEETDRLIKTCLSEITHVGFTYRSVY